MGKQLIQRQLIGVDVDGTLTDGVCWTSEECLNAKAIQKNIDIVNKLYDSNFIIIYTARRDYLIEATIKWLHKNGVRFHAISNNKIPLNITLDEDSMRFSDFESIEYAEEVSDEESVTSEEF